MQPAILAASRAVEAVAAAAEGAYRRREPVPDEPSLGAATRDWCRAVARLAAGAGDAQAFTAGRAESVGRDLATVVHVRAHLAFAGGAGSSDPALLTAAELGYRARLAALRCAAIGGDLAAVGRALRLLTGPDLARLEAVCAAAGSAAEGISQGAIRVRASQLARSSAALAAGAVVLQQRLADGRLRTTTAGIASRRTTLARGHAAALPAATGLAGSAPGDRLALVARTTAVTWVDRPERPYTRLDLADGSQLRAHFRNLRGDGLSGSHWVWARAKVEAPDGGTAYAVLEFEGPTGTAGSVWEDWLHVEARDAYDLAPRAIDLVADFPDLAAASAPLDLYARTTRRDD